ncbi:hypothetical protein AB0C96_37920 [Streptomyces sp. NPDC048506]|uniref:hypothetical protein n=1 Tax=Streptomyces sp. NPDC048506 TaxID=3155028 RepID=UPI00342EE7E3
MYEKSAVSERDAGAGKSAVPMEQPDAPERVSYDASPWWAGLGPVGGAVLVLLGVVAGVLSFLGLPEGHAVPTALYGAGKAVAIGLVIVGTALIGRLRGAGAPDPDAGAVGEHEGEHEKTV